MPTAADARRPSRPRLRTGPPTSDALLELLASPNIRSRAWIYRRYDHLVGSRTVRRPGLDAAVLRLRPSFRGLAVSLDGSGRIARLDPHTGGALAVLEAARNVACAGGEPLAITDCLNFGNPEKPEIAWELAEAIEGMAVACEALGIPVVSGNVSLYNETDGRAIHPTPVVGCVGLVADVRAIPGTWREGDAIYLAGEPELSLDGSEYQALYGELAGRPAPLDLAAEAELVRDLHETAPRCSLVHDAAEGGLAVALAEAAIASGVGAELDLPDDALTLFGEGGGQAVLASSADLDRPAHRDRRREYSPRRPRRATAASLGGRSRHLMCGVFGIRAPDRDVARVTYFGLFALQHRGQESAGIAVSDRGRLTVLRDMGLVAQVFDEQNLSGLQGEVAIGHTRYSTTGSTHWTNAQPIVQHGTRARVTLGHNGNLTNVEELREELAADGVQLTTTSDTEVIAALIANDPAPLEDAVADAMREARGRVHDRRARRGEARRLSRSARLSAAQSRADRRRRGARLRDLRARPRRRRARARDRARRARRDR